MLHDGIIVGCAALYPHSEEEAELACLAVGPEHREWGYGEQLMKRIEKRARGKDRHQAPVRAHRPAPNTGSSSAASSSGRKRVDDLPRTEEGNVQLPAAIQGPVLRPYNLAHSSPLENCHGPYRQLILN